MFRRALRFCSLIGALAWLSCAAHSATMPATGAVALVGDVLLHSADGEVVRRCAPVKVLPVGLAPEVDGALTIAMASWNTLFGSAIFDLPDRTPEGEPVHVDVVVVPTELGPMFGVDLSTNPRAFAITAFNVRPDGCMGPTIIVVNEEILIGMPSHVIIHVIVHELGHALGLAHVVDPANLMYPTAGERSPSSPEITCEQLDALRQVGTPGLTMPEACANIGK